MLLEQFPERTAFLAGVACCGGHVAATEGECAPQIAALECFDGTRLGRTEGELDMVAGEFAAAASCAAFCRLEGEGANPHGLVIAEQKFAVDHVLQLTNVAGPCVVLECRERGRI